MDATDNLAARCMTNDAAVLARKPFVSGAALKMYCQLSVFNYDADMPCFRRVGGCLAHSEVCRLESALQIPVARKLLEPEKTFAQIKEQLDVKNTKDIYVVCRKGTAS